MISYLPEIYPDELVYSWFCRYYVHSGCLTHKMALDDILYKRCNNPSKEFLGHLNPDIQKKIREILPIETLILQHTMFPQYARFIPLESKKKAMYHLVYDFKDVHHLFAVLPRTDTDRYLKYCPLCADEDRRKYGENYWHRNHQIRGMQVCYKHNCMLESSDITAKSEQTFTFCPAEEYAVKRNARGINNTPSRSFAEYLTAAFNAPIEFEKDIPISSVFYYAMTDAQYITSTGKTRFTKRLADDLKAFYEGIGIGNIASIHQIQRVLLGDRFDFSVICQIAFYLGISIKDLTAPEITKAQIEKEQATHYMKDKIPLDWQTLDDELSIVLEETARDIYNGSATVRPERVSEQLIYRELDLSAHRLENLPKCRAIFERHTESYEENWARRIVWAYHKLKAERKDKPFYWSDIRQLSGVKKHNIEKVIPLIWKYTDKKTGKIIIRLIE